MKQNLLRRSLCSLLIAVMALSTAACANPDQDTTTGSGNTEVTNGTVASSVPSADASTEPAGANEIRMLSLSVNPDADTIRYINVYQSENEGKYTVDYQGEIRKQAELDAAALSELAAQIETAGLSSLNGKNASADGEASASMYVEFADGTTLEANYSGTVGEEFQGAYATMEQYFQTVLADVPEYVSQPAVAEGVDEKVLAEIQAVMTSSGMENQDTLMITAVPKDDFFGTAVGLSNPTGITGATSCGAMMNTTAYSFVIVTLEEGADAKTVMDDFQASMDWSKWVCVAPTNALIAQKDNMVLCLMGSDQMFEQTKAGIEANGWQNLVTLDNPDM